MNLHFVHPGVSTRGETRRLRSGTQVSLKLGGCPREMPVTAQWGIPGSLQLLNGSSGHFGERFEFLSKQAFHLCSACWSLLLPVHLLDFRVQALGSLHPRALDFAFLEPHTFVPALSPWNTFLPQTFFSLTPTLPEFFQYLCHLLSSSFLFLFSLSLSLPSFLPPSLPSFFPPSLLLSGNVYCVCCTGSHPGDTFRDSPPGNLYVGLSL